MVLSNGKQAAFGREHLGLNGLAYGPSACHVPRSAAVPGGRVARARAETHPDRRSLAVLLGDGERPKLGATLSEATVFSLYVLMIDALQTAKRHAYPMPGIGDLEVRVTHPNWMSSDSMVALGYLRDAAVIAAMRVFDWPEYASDDSGSARCRLIAALDQTSQAGSGDVAIRSQLVRVRHVCGLVEGRHSDDHLATRVRILCCWFLIPREREPATFDPDDPELPARPRKLLVVDIGAGSTDSGYMLRTDTSRARSLNWLWLPAAVALPRAGRWLTDRIRQDWLQQGRPGTEAEAEDYKTGGTEDWYTRHYVKAWCESIAEHVGDYIEHVPDSTRLPRNPPLEIVVTGV